MDYKSLAEQILKESGEASNISTAANCMTRLRMLVKDPSKVNNDKLKKIDGVLGTVFEGNSLHVVLGPGKARKVTEEVNSIIATNPITSTNDINVEREDHEEEPKLEPLTGNAVQIFFKRIGRWFKRIKFKKGLKHVGNIFGPLIPGFIMYGLCLSVANIILAAVGGNPETLKEPGYETARLFNTIFSCFGQGFFAYLAIFVGINSAKEFKVSTIVGGIIGGISIFGDLEVISEIIHMVDSGGTAYIRAGRGGILAVILMVYLIGFVERFIKKHVPDVLDIVVTTFLTVVIGGSFFIFAFMPLMGFVSDGIFLAVKNTFGSQYAAVRIISGFFAAGFFQMLVMFGLHWGLLPLYMAGIDGPYRNTRLYPVLAMADAAQFGAAVALFFKAKKYNHQRLKKNVQSVLIPSFCGVSEPLIFGASLPLIKPFLPIGLAAGTTGMLVAYLGIGATAVGPSGPLAIPLMTYLNDAANAGGGIGYYVMCWAIAVVLGFFFTTLLVREKDLNRMPKD